MKPSTNPAIVACCQQEVIEDSSVFDDYASERAVRNQLMKAEETTELALSDMVSAFEACLQELQMTEAL